LLSSAEIKSRRVWSLDSNSDLLPIICRPLHSRFNTSKLSVDYSDSSSTILRWLRIELLESSLRFLRKYFTICSLWVLTDLILFSHSSYLNYAFSIYELSLLSWEFKSWLTCYPWLYNCLISYVTLLLSPILTVSY
jgi:hypothetical protein